MEKKKWSMDIVVGIVLLAASAFLTFTAFTKQSPEARQFPLLILFVFMIMAVALVVKGVKDTMDSAAGKPANVVSVKFDEIKYSLLIFVLIVIYVVAVDIVGFIVPSIIFTAGLMWYNYARNKIALVAVPCGLVAFLYVLFTFILKTKLP